MEKVIENFEKEISKCNEMEKKNLMKLLNYMHDVIENPVQYQSDGKILDGVALYSMTEAEYKEFVEGKVISPKSIYEKFGLTLIGDKRYYGNGEIPIETSRPVEEEIDI